MNAKVKKEDSDDSDCFIVEEIKPVKKPVMIRSNTSNILYSKISKNNKKNGKVRKRNPNSDEVKPRKKRTKSADSGINSKKKSNLTTDACRKSKPLSNCKGIFSEVGKKSGTGIFNYDLKQEGKLQNSDASKTGSPSKPLNFSDNCKNGNLEKIQLSPEISRKRKRFRFQDTTFKPAPSNKNFKKPLLKMFDSVEENTNLLMEESSDEISQNVTEHDNSKLLTFLMKEMIQEETKKHSSLILESEREVLDKFFNLKETACRVFVKMLCRKKSWHRVCDIVYKNISENLEYEFEILHKENYVDISIGDEDLKVQMDLLKKPEVLNLCKAFNVSLKFIDSSRKEVLIHSLIQDCQKQKSALDMFKGKNSTTRLDRLRSEVKKYLGMCIRLNETTFLAFYKILLLSSFPHYNDEESQRFRNEFLIRSQVQRNIIKFPACQITSVVVFETVTDFEEYRKALVLYDSLEVSICSKNYEKFVCICLESKEEFKKLLQNDEYQKRFLNLKPFLRKFSAGTLYARILTRYCTTFKRKVENLEVRSTVELLLSQNLFLIRKKGEWYEILSNTFKNQKQNNEAAEVIIKALKDPLISEVQKLTLQLRGQLLLKVQSCSVSKTDLRDALNELCTSSVQEPHSIEIKGIALGENESGFRCVYIEEVQNGKRYISVEERAISHYKLNGFTKGYHTEGVIIQSIYFLLFYDIIYGISPEGVFQSPYQEAPLDFNSSSFYDSRKEEIDILLSDMSGWNDQEVEAKIKDAYYRNYGTNCLIKWSDELTAELFCEIAKCITMPILVLIFQKFVRNFREVRAGFPDLTLWNPKTKKCKFVEVKSPSDRLSPGQRVWLDFLRNIGLDCEVCNIKNVSGKCM